MKSFLSKGLIVFFCAGLSGCELLCQAGTGTCGMTKEQRQKIRNPKTYGEFWTKPGMTKEGWRQDWVECGGMSSGQYSGNVPPRSTTAVILAATDEARKKLDSCMQSKGYEFKYTNQHKARTAGTTPALTTMHLLKIPVTESLKSISNISKTAQ